MGNRIKTFPGNIAGSVFTAASSDAIKPPVGHLFVAFTVLTQATFDASGGLVSNKPEQFANTEDAAGDLVNDAETTSEGSGGVQITNSNTTFPAGSTIYGSYTEIDLASSGG